MSATVYPMHSVLVSRSLAFQIDFNDISSGTMPSKLAYSLSLKSQGWIFGYIRQEVLWVVIRDEKATMFI